MVNYKRYGFIENVTSNLTSSLSTIGSVSSLKEAEIIGEGLVNAGLLIPICLGLYPSNADPNFSKTSPLSIKLPGSMLSSIQSEQNIGVSNTTNKFSSSTAYIYTYPGTINNNSSTKKVKFALFGDVIAANISSIVKRTAAPSAGSLTVFMTSIRSEPSLELSDVSNSSATSKPAEQADGAETQVDNYVEYEITLSNSSESWTVFRR